MTSLHSPPNAQGARDFVKQSSLYQEFLAEREEILRHKWLESERLGHDIGFERALLDWIRKHRDSWRAARRAQSAHTSTRSNPPHPVDAARDPADTHRAGPTENGAPREAA